MTVLIYVNTSKQIGDPEHIKVFATIRTPRKPGSRKTTRKAWRSQYRGSGVKAGDLPLTVYAITAPGIKRPHWRDPGRLNLNGMKSSPGKSHPTLFHWLEYP